MTVTFASRRLVTIDLMSANRLASSSVDRTRPEGPTRPAAATVIFPLPAPISAILLTGFQSRIVASCSTLDSEKTSPVPRGKRGRDENRSSDEETSA